MDIHMHKIKQSLQSILILYENINIKWSMYLKGKLKIIKFLEEITGENVCDPVIFRIEFLDNLTKVWSMKEKMINCTWLKLGISDLWETWLWEGKDKPQTGIKIFQIRNLIRNVNLDYIKLKYYSAIKKEWRQLHVTTWTLKTLC